MITSKGVLALLGFTLVNYLGVLLSLTTFIAVLLTLTRSYRDSEMVVWFSSGVALTRWIRPSRSRWPLAVVIGLLSLVLSPWAVSRSEDLRRIMDSRDDVAAIVPGVFRESSRAERVYFVEEISGSENMVAKVFVSSNQHQSSASWWRAAATRNRGERRPLPRAPDRQALRRHTGDPRVPALRVERYAMRVEIGEARARAPTTKTMATIDLISEPSARHLAELSWRIGLP